MLRTASVVWYVYYWYLHALNCCILLLTSARQICYASIVNDTDRVIVIRKQVHIAGQVEIARSFSYKLNVGSYESRDFFCSQKAQCDAGEAEQVSELLYQFCKNQVLLSVKEYLNSLQAQRNTDLRAVAGKGK